MKVLIFGGTTEGRNLSEFLLDLGFMVVLCVATDYGASKIGKNSHLEIIQKRMDRDEMINFISEHSFDYVVDGTHPYANIVTKNIKEACDNQNIKLLRLTREKSKIDRDITYVRNIDMAVDFLKNTEGNIFLTIGSKGLEKFTEINDFNKRCYVRIIPMVASLEKATKLDFNRKNIICMEGPFSLELNKIMFKMANAKYLVTKESGQVGGFHEKIRAGKNMGCHIVVISRPNDEEGYTWDRIIDFFRSL